MSNGFQTLITRVIFSLLHSPHDRSARSSFALSPEGGERKGLTEHKFPWVISLHLFWTVKWQLVVKSSQSIPSKCQTSTAPRAHKEIIERPWREAKGTWLMFHLISPPRLLSPGSPACVTWTSGLQPAAAPWLPALSALLAAGQGKQSN